MELTFAGKLTKEEYMAVLHLSKKKILKKNAFTLDLWLLLILSGLIFFILGIYTVKQDISGNPTPLYIVEFIISFLLITIGIKLRNVPSKYWEENQEALSKMSGKITENHIEISTLHGNLTFPWSDLTGYGEYKGILVLYKSNMVTLPFMERFFPNQEDWFSFTTTVKTRLQITHRINQTDSPAPNAIVIYLLLAVAILILLFTKTH